MSLKDNFNKFMSSFDKGYLVGIDIGLSAVKVALISSGKKNQFVLEKFARIPLGEAVIIEDEIQKPDEVAGAIESALKKAGVSKKIVCLGMDGPNTMTKRLKVPSGSKEELQDNIEWEAEQYITFGIDESQVDFHIIQKLKEEDVVDVLVAAVEENVVERYLSILKSLDLVPKVVDLSILALSNMFEKINYLRLEEISDEGAIVIDFGAQTTKILVYRNHAPVLTKEINLGGVLVTEEIQRAVGVSYEEAEDLKVLGDDNGNIPEDLIPIIQAHNIKLLEEVKKTLNFYIAAGSSDQVGYCFVTGGSANLPGTIESLQDLVGLEVEILNPFDVISLKTNLSEKDKEDIASSGIISLGLALREA